jgi:hypothetical protein
MGWNRFFLYQSVQVPDFSRSTQIIAFTYFLANYASKIDFESRGCLKLSYTQKSVSEYR